MRAGSQRTRHLPRRDEDRAALDRLAAFLLQLPFADCIYRVDPITLQPLYDSEAAIFGSIREAVITGRVAAALRSKIAAIRSSGSTVKIFVPLTAGRHVDHLIARAVAEHVNQPLIYSEDFPYAENSTKLQPVWDADKWQLKLIALRAEALHT